MFFINRELHRHMLNPQADFRGRVATKDALGMMTQGQGPAPQEAVLSAASGPVGPSDWVWFSLSSSPSPDSQPFLWLPLDTPGPAVSGFVTWLLNLSVLCWWMLSLHSVSWSHLPRREGAGGAVMGHVPI